MADAAPHRAVYAVVGAPILHSRSPQLYRAAFDALGIDARYLRCSCARADEVQTLMTALELDGVNVTAPLKKDCCALMDRLDHTAERLGAVNTCVRRDGAWVGLNTDPDGVTAAFASAAVELAERRALVVGAGGAGRAAALALGQAGAEVTIVNRTDARARAAAERIGRGCVSAPWDRFPEHLESAQLLVCSVSTQQAVIPAHALHPALVVLDARYPTSPLIENARAIGCTTIDGRSWLAGQAAAAVTAFTGQRVSITVLERAAATDHLGASSRQPTVALIGLSGAGKSSVGRHLARELGWRFIDTDAAVTDRLGASVPAIFGTDGTGEPRFRSAERAVIAEALASDAGPLVLAVGGGALLAPETRTILRNRSIPIWLWVDPAVAAARVEPGTRPLIDPTPRSVGGAAANRERKLQALLEARVEHYASLAVGVIATDALTPKTIARRLKHDIGHALGL